MKRNVKMKCEFNYCVYNKNYKCVFDEISIDSLGMCECCEIVAIPEKNLNIYKNKRLKEIDKYWKNADSCFTP